MRLVLHIVRVIGLHRVDDDLFWKLNGKSIFIDGDLLNIVTASNFDAGL